MSPISDDGQAKAQLLPSYDALRRAHRPISLSTDAKRLFWSLNGPLTTSIWIMEDAYSPDSREPYFRQVTGAGTTASWHPASQSPLTEPKVSSITVSVDDLEQWENHWLDLHRDHAEPDGGEANGPESLVKFGALPDYDPDEDEEGPQHLLVCCGAKRPRGKAASVIVKPSASSGNEFVTLHNYLSTVHPWLMSLREDILGAMGILDDKPLPAETKIMVDYGAPQSLKMYNEAEWIHLNRSGRATCWHIQISPITALSLRHLRMSETPRGEVKRR